MNNTNPALTCIYVRRKPFQYGNVNKIDDFNWFISTQYMGTVLAVIYAADTIVAYKYYRDSGDWLLFTSLFSSLVTSGNPRPIMIM